MTNKILAGTRVVIASTQETIRSEAFATLGIEGWEANTLLPESDAALAETLSTNSESLIVAILEPAPAKFDLYMKMVREAKIPDSRIVIGVPRSSLVHRAYLRTGIEGFPFSVETTPTGQRIELSTLVTSLQTVWQKHCTLQLDRELTDAMESSALALIQLCTNVESTAVLKERAHLAYSLTSHINSDITFRQRVIRLSLFADIVRHENWQRVVDESRNLWAIKSLLEAKASMSHGNVVGTLVWPKTTPIELAIVETATLVQRRTDRDATAFRDELAKYSKSLSLETRATLKQAVEACFTRIWSKADERKTSTSG